MTAARTIGIDFGTHKTLVARWDEAISRPVLVRLRPANGDDMPSVVHVDTAGQMTFGDEAEALGATDAEGCQRAFKRDLGLNAAPYLLHAHEFTARDLAREYLRWIKCLVEEESLHGAVEHAVMTVPASWLPGAKAELKQAAAEAGFSSVELLDEPVAAGLAFLHSRSGLWSEGALLVFDWGAGTLDLAVLTLADGGPRLAPDLVGGKAGLGGEDVDRHLMQMVNKRLVQLGLTKLERRAPEDVEKVRWKVQEWKVRHAVKPGAVWELAGLPAAYSVPLPAGDEPRPGLSWTSEEIAARVTEKIEEALAACTELMERARAKAITPAGILLVGGSSQFPALKTLLEQRFPETRLLAWDQRISAVALGAAWHAAVAAAPETSSGTSISEIKPEPAMTTDSANNTQDELLKQQLNELGAFPNEGWEMYLPGTKKREFSTIARLAKPKLRTLHLIGSDWADTDIEELLQMEVLRKIFVGSKNITDRSLLYLSRIQSLEEIDLGSSTSPDLTASGCRVLSRLPRLDYLSLPSRLQTVSRYLDRAKWEERRTLIRYLKQSRPDLITEPSQEEAENED